MCRIVISECQLEDLNELSLWYNLIPQEDKDNLSFDFSTNGNSLTYFTLKVDEIIVGLMCAQIGDSRIKFLSRFVAREYRRKGYAEMMLDHLIIKARNEKKIALSGYIRTSRIAGIEFFKSKGFEVSPAAYDHTYNEDISMVMLKLR